MIKCKMPSCLLFAFFIIISLQGCITTEYQARDFFGDGYVDVRISENTYKVDFQCNQNTPETLCEGYLFRRCAELTLNAGYDNFIMTDHATIIKEDDVVVPGHYNTETTGSGNDRKTTMIFQQGYVVKNRYPVSKATIKIFRGAVPIGEKNAYSAREILKYASIDKKTQ